MSFRTAVVASLAAASVLGLGASPTFAAAADRGHCFLATHWDDWKSPDPHTILVRVGISRVYRFELSHPSSELSDPSVHLISKLNDVWICDPLDLQLYAADDHGIMREPLFVRNITELTPDEIRAIPARYRP